VVFTKHSAPLRRGLIVFLAIVERIFIKVLKLCTEILGLINHENKDEFNQKLSGARNEIARLEGRRNELAQMVKFYDGEVNFEEVFKSLKTFSDLIGKTDRPEVLQSFVKSRVTRIEMSPDKKQFTLKLRAFDPLYHDCEWWAQLETNTLHHLASKLLLKPGKNQWICTKFVPS
jgi:hypothetical protein